MPVLGDYTYAVETASMDAARFGGESSVNWSMIIWRTDGAALLIDKEEGAMLTAGVLPFPDDLYVTGTPTTELWTKLARYRGHKLETIDNCKVRAQLRWSTLYAVDPEAPNSLVLPSSAEYTAVTRSTTIYRSAWSVSPPAATDASSDIGGSSLAGNDQGTPCQVAQVRIRMRFTQDASVVSMLTAATTLTTYIGTKNSASFAGFAANSLICEGVNIGDAGNEFYEVVFDFTFDAWYQHEQVATTDADGRAKRTSGGALSEVKWKRLNRLTTDFNDIYSLDTALKTRTEKGWWL
jgi:hypothetical protein